MCKPSLTRAIPNEQFQMILEFDNCEYRLLDMTVLCKEKGWDQLAYPQHMKDFALSGNAISWPQGGKADANYLYLRSNPITQETLERQSIRLSYKNQAPTSQDQRHHVYCVFLAPFSEKAFRIEESIGGGHAERGGGQRMSITELLAWPEWRDHFKLSGCSWAVPLVESCASQPEQLLDLLIDEACKRNGLAEHA